MLAPWKKNYDQPRQHIEKQRHYFANKGLSSQRYVFFPVVMHGCESWTIKKAECWRIDAFELWCWRRLLRVPWPVKRSNQSILKEISPEYSLGGLMLKLKLQYFGHLMWRADSFEKDPDARQDWRWEEKGTTGDEMVGWHHPLNGHEFENSGSWCLAFCTPCGHKELDTTERLNWTTTTKIIEWTMNNHFWK